MQLLCSALAVEDFQLIDGWMDGGMDGTNCGKSAWIVWDRLWKSPTGEWMHPTGCLKKGSYVKWAILGALKAFLRHTLQLVALTNDTRACSGTTGNTLVSLQCTLQPLEAIQ